MRKGDDLTTFTGPKVEKIRSLNLPDPQEPARPVAGKLYLYLNLTPATSLPSPVPHPIKFNRHSFSSLRHELSERTDITSFRLLVKIALQLLKLSSGFETQISSTDYADITTMLFLGIPIPAPIRNQRQRWNALNASYVHATHRWSTRRPVALQTLLTSDDTHAHESEFKYTDDIFLSYGR